MIVSILGCGWFGQALGRALVQRGVTVNGSTTTAAKLVMLRESGITPYLIDLASGTGSVADSAFFACNVLVVAIPPRTRQQPAGQYVAQLQHLVEVLRTHRVARVIFISATSVYGDSNSEVDERDKPVPDTPAGATLLEAEALFSKQTFFATTVVRFAGLIGPGRDPGRFFAGKKAVANGLAPVNLIHLDDCVGICLAILDKQWFGHTVNACAPQHPARMEFYTRASARADLDAPEFVEELNGWKIVRSVLLEEKLGYRIWRTLD